MESKYFPSFLSSPKKIEKLPDRIEPTYVTIVDLARYSVLCEVYSGWEKMGAMS